MQCKCDYEGMLRLVVDIVYAGKETQIEFVKVTGCLQFVEGSAGEF